MRKSILSAITAAALLVSANAGFAAETIYGAMAKAYENNSTLNYSRAGLRATNEAIPLAKSGFRPRVSSSASFVRSGSSGSYPNSTASFGISINQALFDGFQTRNNVQSAEAQIRAQRANLANTELNTLFDAAQAFMDVLQNRQIASLRAQNIESLKEQLRSERARFDVGEGTRTDVAQAESSLAQARAQLASAEADARAAEATYQQVVGTAPGSLKPATALSKILPKSLASAEQIAASGHPSIIASQALVDSGVFDVKSSEGAFLPQVQLNAGVSQTFVESDNLQADGSSTSGNIGIDVTVPIYQGGAASATVRQNKELLGQARIDVDVKRDAVRSAVTSAFTALDASRQALAANQQAVRAAQLALNGVVEERNVGQRTTLDVLNARSTVLNNQISLVQAERNLVVSSYALASAIGRLSAKRLGLRVAAHDPEEHYNAVKDKWYGLRTPDGR
jgi:outer membrane protein